MLIVCVGVGIPVFIGAVDPYLPRPLWVVLFLVVFATLVLAACLGERPVVQRITYGVAVVLSWAVVLTVHSSGMLPILLVVTAAVGADFVRLPAIVVVIALNTFVIGLAWARGNETWPGLLLGMSFYALIQIASVLMMITIRREQRLRRELAEAHVEQQAASVLLQDAARTAERLRISRDLHDLIGHQLTVLTLELEAAEHRHGAPAHEHVVRANRVARDLLADVRSTVGELRTAPSTDLGDALRSVGFGLSGLDVAVEVDADVEVDEEQSAVLVRAMQEIVTNTLRHAEARKLWVTVTRGGDSLRLTAVDDGEGTARLVVGNGLQGLSERVAGLGGEVDFDGRQGFRVTARIPVRTADRLVAG